MRSSISRPVLARNERPRADTTPVVTVELEAERVADGDDQLAALEPLGIAELRRRQRHRRVDPDEREVRVRIVADHARGKLAALDRGDIQTGSAADHVAIGEHEPVGCDDDAGAGACVRARPVRLDVELDHGGADAVDHVGHRARIGIEQRLILGRDGGRFRGFCPIVEHTNTILCRSHAQVANQSWRLGVVDLQRVGRYGERMGVAVEHLLTGLRPPPAAQPASVIDMTNRTSLSPFFRVLAGVLLLLAATGCGDNRQQAAAPPPPEVTVAKPVRRTIVDQDEYVGRFVAIDAVEVRARVSGYLENVHFEDGQIVKQGDLLFTIDARPFNNIVEQSRAALAQARANLAYTESDLRRGQQLVRDKTITEQTFDQRTQAARNAQASVASAEAAVRQAELDLQFTQLRAPVTGRIGDRRVSPGNLVTGGTSGNTTLLATIVSTDPIRFEFTFDEASYLRYERLAGGRRDAASQGLSFEVMLKLIDETDFQHRGRMDFVDNVIDRASGTIRARAVFANRDNIFTPGMFARVQVPGSPPYEALMVADAAIGTEQARKYVLVVAADGTANQKYVSLGQVVDGLRVIKDGLSAEDRVIVNGLMRARPGQKVAPQEQATAAADAPVRN